MIQNYINRTKRVSNTDSLTQFCKKAISSTRQFIKNNPDVLIMEADKGNRTVIMDLQDYNMKMGSLVEDTTIYEEIKRDPTTKYQKDNNNIVRRLLDLKLIDNRTRYKLTNNAAVCPRIYGQPKAHKPGLPLRPVVPNVTAPTYELSKYIANILQKAFSSSFNIKDSYAFCEYVNGLQVPPDHLIVSFDVISLFTNVPIDLVRQGIISMWTDIKKHTNINLDFFIEIVEFCVDASYFCFRGKFYHQKFGTAMGSPLSPILADIVLENLMLWAARTANIPPELIKKYVDDTFIILHKNQIETTLHIFNRYNTHLQFTCEIEKDNKLAFLDTMVIRTENNTLKTDWYAKPISSGRLLNFYSFHPYDQKIGVASNFIDRVRAFSKVKTKHEQDQLILQRLQENNYPKPLINRLLHRQPPLPQPVPALSSPTTTDTEPIQYRSIPYVHTLSSMISKTLQNNIPSIRVTTRSTNTNQKLYPNPKDPVPQSHKYNIVYEIPCQNCRSCYVGMTTNSLQKRLSGHQSTINSLDNKLQQGHQYHEPEIQHLKGRTALVEHCIDHQHRFDLTNTRIVDHTFKRSTLPILEMCHIATNPHTINRRTDTDNLNRSYSNIIHTLRKPVRDLPQTSHSNNNIPSSLDVQ
ncbi:uncharacterized protein LOC134290731 [Aedes albopictus]|uniref:Reverse transcriptase domain-containing protein n=1 Tax=Aedes albopictus TaxID=7160 RepID=A0ABM1XSE0_AEDAL